MKIDRFNVHKFPRLKDASLLVGWRSSDLGQVSVQVMDFLIASLQCSPVAELEPLDFFSFDGAEFLNNLVQVPEARLWASEEHNMLIFKTDEPTHRQHLFLSGALDFCTNYCGVNRVYTVNGLPSMLAHTQPRTILAVFNREGLREKLGAEEEVEYMDWEGPPAISSYLLWVAGRREMDGLSLWPEIPFYLSALEDPGAIRRTVNFLQGHLQLPLNPEPWEQREEEMMQKLDRLREQNSTVQALLEKIESEISLNEQEQMTITQEVYRFLS